MMSPDSKGLRPLTNCSHSGTVTRKLLFHQIREPEPIRKVRIATPEGMAEVRADLSGTGAQAGLLSLGTFRFPAGPAKVVISNEGASGYVLIDAEPLK